MDSEIGDGGMDKGATIPFKLRLVICIAAMAAMIERFQSIIYRNNSRMFWELFLLLPFACFH